MFFEIITFIFLKCILIYVIFSGLSACSLTLLTIVAPMSKLLHVIRVKNTQCLPFPMILMSFFVSTLWFLYGMIVQDAFLQVIIYELILIICQYRYLIRV